MPDPIAVPGTCRECLIPFKVRILPDGRRRTSLVRCPTCGEPQLLDFDGRVVDVRIGRIDEPAPG